MGYTVPLKDDIEDRLLAAIIGGTFLGLGSGLYLKVGGSAGGLDLLALALKKKYSFSSGPFFMLISIFNLLLAYFSTDSVTMLYSLVFMVSFSVSVNKMQGDFAKRKMVFIISKKAFRIAEAITKELGGGATFITAKGGWSNEEYLILFTTISQVHIGRLKEILYREDIQAFVTIQNAEEVIGYKFTTWEDEGYERLHSLSELKNKLTKKYKKKDV